MNPSTSPVTAIIRLLKNWWWLVLISVAIGGGVGYFVRSKQPDIYMARATVLFGQFFSTTQNQSLQAVSRQIDTFIGLIRTEKVVQPVIDRLNLGIDIDQFNERMQVNQVTGLPLLEIIISDLDRDMAANIANAIAQQMIDESPTSSLIRDAEFQRQQLGEIQAQITQLENEYNNLLATGATLTSAFEITQNKNQTALTLDTLQELRNLYANLRVGLLDSSNILSIFNYATANNTIVISSSVLSIVLAAGGGLILSLLTITLIGFFDDRLQWQEGMTRIEGVDVLGPLGIIPKNKLPLYVANMPNSVEAEVIRQLRAKLVLAANGQQPKVVTVNSYDSGDGKTITSSNLALAAAKSGLRTLLIDGDIRKGNLHECFRLPNVMGISDILAGRDDITLLLSRALLDSGYENLTILTAGRASNDPASLLSSNRFKELIEILKTQFDTIVMDSVPSVGGPDAAFMAEQSDGVLIVAHGQRTTHRGLRRTIQSLKQGREDKVKIFGVAFNRIALQITSTYNKPYYRRDLAINPEKLNQELINAGKRPGILRRGTNVMVDPNGNRLYSIAAASVQLGVSVETLHEWIKSGYIKGERVNRREWISEIEIANLLERLPRHEIISNRHANDSSQSSDKPVRAVTGKLSSGKLRDLVGNQREVLLREARAKNEDEEK